MAVFLRGRRAMIQLAGGCENNLLQLITAKRNPFEKFERKRFVYYSKDLSMVSFNPALWQKLTDERKEWVREKETKFLEQYYEKLGGM